MDFIAMSKDLLKYDHYQWHIDIVHQTEKGSSKH